MREVIGNAQALDAPTIGQTVRNEVQSPHLIHACRYCQWHPLTGRAPHLLALAHCQLRLAVEQILAVVIYARELRAQQVMDAAIAEAAPHLCDLDDLGAELLRGLVDHRRIAIAIPGEPNQTARTAFGQMMLGKHLGRRCAPDLQG